MNNAAQPDLPSREGGENMTDDQRSSPSTPNPNDGAIIHHVDKYSSNLQRLTALAEKTYDKFTVFPKLALELRFKIWRHTFPDPRIVFLERIYRGGRRCILNDEIEAKDFQMFPTSLYINKESRGETLRAYHIFCPPDDPFAKICFSPTRDLISFSFISLLLLGHNVRYQLLEIESQKACLRSIKSLNVWGADWKPENRDMFDEIQFPHKMNRYCCSIRSVLLFASLEELRIYFAKGHYDGQYDRTTAMEECKAGFTACLELHAESFEGSRVPRVIVQGMESVKGTF